MPNTRKLRALMRHQVADSLLYPVASVVAVVSVLTIILFR
jgi:hypothetical protein